MINYNVILSNSSGTYDITKNVLSATMNKTIDESATTLELRCKNILIDHVMDTVNLIVDGITRFKGTVKSQNDSKSEILKVSTLKCIDDTDKFQRRLIAEVYENLTAKQILLDLISKYTIGITTNNVQDIGGTIESFVVNYESLSGAIQNLADLSGAYWFLDVNNDLHFFIDNEGVSSINFDGSKNILLNSFNLESTALDLTNRVWIIGAKTASSSYIEQYWIGDGVNQIFQLAYVPNYTEVFENDIEKTIEVEKGEASNKDYTYDKKNKVLKRVSGPLPQNVQLRFRYRPTVQVIDYFEDPGSVAKYGLYEKAIRDRKITDKAAARKRGRAALRKTKAIRRIMSWDTRDWKVDIGKLVSIKVGSFNIFSQARINSVSVTFTPYDVVASIDAQEVY